MKRQNSVKFLWFFGVFFLCCACGLKGPPVPPGETLPAAPLNLKVERVEEGFLLTWENTGKKPLGFRVYRAPLPEDSCKDCPRLFSLLAELEPEAQNYLDMIRSEGPFFYEVRAFIAGDVEGKGALVQAPTPEKP